MPPAKDWDEWHRAYDDPDSDLSRRLSLVQQSIDAFLDETSPAPVRVLSVCAGDGRDLIEVLRARHDSGRVSATLLDSDERLTDRARATSQGLDVVVHHVDGGDSANYVGAVPADLVLLCGIFGNVPDAEIRRLVQASPQFCRTGARVIWTRHTRPPDLTPALRGWFRDAGFDEVAFIAPDDLTISVGVESYRGELSAAGSGRPPVQLRSVTRQRGPTKR